MTAIIALSDPERFVLSCRAVLAVSCPKCKAPPGQMCQSTGGGNPANVATHAMRRKRIEPWSDEQLARFAELVKAQGSQAWWHLPEGYYAESEAAAAPVVVKAKSTSPRGVRLTENQAEEIERTVARGGVAWASTAHFHGDAAHRQTVNALRDKGILVDAGLSEDGCYRMYWLTSFGWQVYRLHRLIIHRFTPEQVNELEAAAVAELPKAAEDRVRREIAAIGARVRRQSGPRPSDGELWRFARRFHPNGYPRDFDDARVATLRGYYDAATTGKNDEGEAAAVAREKTTKETAVE